MTRHYRQLRDDFVRGEPLPATQYNSLVRVLDAQAEGALQGIGAGVVSGGEVTPGEGLSVNVSALAAVAETQYGHCFLCTYGEPDIVDGLPANSTVYIWATAVFGSAPGQPDSRESAVVYFVWDYSDEGVADGVLLAKVVTGQSSVSSVTDRRTWVPAQEALRQLNELDLETVRAAIGGAYFGENPPASSLHERVTALESGGGGGGEVIYWGGLERALGDPTTIPQFVDGELQEHVDEYHQGEVGGGGGTAVNFEAFDVEAANQARLVLRLCEAADPDAPRYMQDCLVVVWGSYGDGSGGTPDYIDRDYTTWLPSL